MKTLTSVGQLIAWGEAKLVVCVLTSAKYARFPLGRLFRQMIAHFAQDQWDFTCMFSGATGWQVRSTTYRR
jgi:hypothetical protein